MQDNFVDDLLAYIEVDNEATTTAKKLQLGKRIDILNLSKQTMNCLSRSHYNYIWQLFLFLDKDSMHLVNCMSKKSQKEIIEKCKDVCGFDIIEDYESKDSLDELDMRLDLCRSLKFIH